MAADSISNRHGKKHGKGKRSQDQPGLPAREQSDEPDAAKSLSETAEQAMDYLSEGVGQFQGQMRAATQGHEGTMVVVALAAGFGMGVAIGTALAAPRRRPHRWTDRLMAEGVGRRVLERLEDMLPQRLTDCLGR